VSQGAAIRVGFIGLGSMARAHLGDVLDGANADVVAVCEPAPSAYARAAAVFAARGLSAPPNEPDWRRFLEGYAGELDAVLIVTPHVHHYTQASAALEAGLDVLVEKPMVMSGDEAQALIEVRDRTNGLLVVAFQGSLSPQIREASRLLRSGVLGRAISINAMAWQNWSALTAGTWRQEPSLSGGGFLFDTGAHMLNTVCDLLGEDVSQVGAWLQNDGHAVDVRGVLMARTASGVQVTMTACGSAIPSCDSDIRVFTSEAILRTGIWGERLEIQRSGERRLRRVPSVSSAPVWQTFSAIRSGMLANPSPPEIGLRMARLWDAIRASAARDGAIVDVAVGAGAAASREPRPVAALPGSDAAPTTVLDAPLGGVALAPEGAGA
jgi:predicted dehydrogenase